ncbi:MAG: hypothetical protein PHH84_02095 [Oscillospiraceae bacterium]|nr:hypothetical protein [Oscillospiraceae bacterium]
MKNLFFKLYDHPFAVTGMFRPVRLCRICASLLAQKDKTPRLKNLFFKLYDHPFAVTGMFRPVRLCRICALLSAQKDKTPRLKNLFFKLINSAGVFPLEFFYSIVLTKC